VRFVALKSRFGLAIIIPPLARTVFLAAVESFCGAKSQIIGAVSQDVVLIFHYRVSFADLLVSIDCSGNSLFS
jgi:hypothetical protein